MSYESLRDEYRQQAQILRKHIKSLKTQYVKSYGLEKEQLEYRISILYPMYLDLLHTTEYLKRKCEVLKKCPRKSVI